MFNSLKEGYEKKCHRIIKKKFLICYRSIKPGRDEVGGGIKNYFVASRIAISSAEI